MQSIQGHLRGVSEVVEKMGGCKPFPRLLEKSVQDGPAEPWIGQRLPSCWACSCSSDKRCEDARESEGTEHRLLIEGGLCSEAKDF